jgi:hypothetical protein
MEWQVRLADSGKLDLQILSGMLFLYKEAIFSTFVLEKYL